MRHLDVFHLDHQDADLKAALDIARTGPMDTETALDRTRLAARGYAKAAHLDAREAATDLGVQVAGRFSAALYNLRATDVQRAALEGLYAGACEGEAPPAKRVVRFGTGYSEAP